MASQEQTFRSFTPQQAAAYAKERGTPYPQAIYQAILDYHDGRRDLVMDIGTGPGKVAFALLPYFDRVVGIDAGPEMINKAQMDAESKGFSSRTSFVVCESEECDKALPAEEVGQVDLITVAMAVHWFDLPQFYAACARTLRQRGTLAIWTSSGYSAHPSTPHHAEVQKLINMHENEALKPYWLEGNRLSRGAYEELGLPWTVKPEVEAFPESDFVRKDWDRNGVPSAPSHPDGTPGKFLMSVEITPDMSAPRMSASSGVVRWREDHPEEAGGDNDPVNVVIKSLKDLLGADARLTVSPSYTLLLLRKK